MDFFTKPVPPDKAAIAGSVSDNRGQRLAAARVLIVGGPAHPDIAALTDSQGRYRFDGLLPGDYTVLVNASGQPQQEGKVAANLGTLAHLDFVLG